jgi:tetratricopeptide (TPR) repeat protein
LLKRGRPAEAVNQFQLAVEHPDLNVDTLVLAGQASYQMGRAGGAQELWEKALELDPNAANAHRWLAVLYYDLGAMQQALGHLQRVAELAPADPRPDRLMGLINKDYERFNRAIGHYRESLRRGPRQKDREAVLFELAECQVKLRDFTSALATLQQCPPHEQKLVLEAECHHNLGDGAKAQALLEEALAQAPSDLPALMLRGTVLSTNGDLVQAKEAFEAAVRHHPKDYRARYKLAQAYRQLGDDESADKEMALAEDLRKLWRKFSELHLDAVEQPVNARLRYEIGQLARQLDRPDLAKNWFRAALLIDPELSEALDALKSLDSVEAGARP